MQSHPSAEPDIGDVGDIAGSRRPAVGGSSIRVSEVRLGCGSFDAVLLYLAFPSDRLDETVNVRTELLMVGVP